MKSLDPRVNRLPKIGQPGQILPKAPLDQLGTFEVFVQPKDGKPFQHEGAVHAPDLEMAYVFAKETFTRRFLCHSLFVAETRNVFVTPMTEGTENIYDFETEEPETDGTLERFEIFHLYKRGKQHVHGGTVRAANHTHAFVVARNELRTDKTVFNVWIVKQSDIRFTSQEDLDLWKTLPEKKFRDALDYKGGEKLKEFLERREGNLK